jgi:hypothetical protein
MKARAAPPPSSSSSLLARLGGWFVASVLGVLFVAALTVVVELAYSSSPPALRIMAEPAVAAPIASSPARPRELAVPRLDDGNTLPAGIAPAMAAAPLPADEPVGPSLAQATPPALKKGARHQAPPRREGRSRQTRIAATPASAPEPATPETATPEPAVAAPAAVAPRATAAEPQDNSDKSDIKPASAWQPPDRRPIDPTNPYGEPR